MSFWNRQPSRLPHCTLSHYKILNWKIFMSFLYFGGTLKQTSFSRAVSKRLVIYWVGSSRDNTLWRLLWMSEPNELSAHLADWPAGCWKGINLVHFTLFSYTLRSVFERAFFFNRHPITYLYWYAWRKAYNISLRHYNFSLYNVTVK